MTIVQNGPEVMLSATKTLLGVQRRWSGSAVQYLDGVCDRAVDDPRQCLHLLSRTHNSCCLLTQSAPPHTENVTYSRPLLLSKSLASTTVVYHHMYSMICMSSLPLDTACITIKLQIINIVNVDKWLSYPRETELQGGTVLAKSGRW